MAYRSASKTLLGKLEVIQAQELRIGLCSGAFETISEMGGNAIRVKKTGTYDDILGQLTSAIETC